MGKILLILVAFIVLAIVAFSFILGFFRRLFGAALRNAFTAPQAQKSTKRGTDTVLYHDNTTEVLQGEHTPHQRPKNTVVREASFSNKTTDTSPGRKN